jgi:hypothetical protein
MIQNQTEEKKKKLTLNKKTVLDLQSLTGHPSKLPLPPSASSPCYSCDLSCQTWHSCCVSC